MRLPLPESKDSLSIINLLVSSLVMVYRRLKLPSKYISMGASFKEQKRKLFIVLFPGHQPVWLNVTFPLPFMIAFQLMRTVLVWKCTSF